MPVIPWEQLLARLCDVMTEKAFTEYGDYIYDDGTTHRQRYGGDSIITSYRCVMKKTPTFAEAVVPLFGRPIASYTGYFPEPITVKNGETVRVETTLKLGDEPRHSGISFSRAVENVRRALNPKAVRREDRGDAYLKGM